MQRRPGRPAKGGQRRWFRYPEDLLPAVEAEAERAGFASLSDYVAYLVAERHEHPLPETQQPRRDRRREEPATRR
jgi:hypothetical protein